MGFVKRLMEEEDDRGWHSGGVKWVCPAHVEDDALEHLLREYASSASCTYCKRSGTEPFAAELDVLIERVATSVTNEWGNADAEGVGWEGGYVGVHYDSYQLLTEALDTPLIHDQLISDVANALPEYAWVQRDFYRLVPHLRLQYAWEDFGRIVKHSRRYFFSDHREEDGSDPDYVAPGALLTAIGEAIRDAELTRTLDVDVAILRVRSHRANEAPTTASELGTPPTECIRSSSRMSPAGVPMFYGALDEDTAIARPETPTLTPIRSRLGRFGFADPRQSLTCPPSLTCRVCSMTSGGTFGQASSSFGTSRQPSQSLSCVIIASTSSTFRRKSSLSGSARASPRRLTKRSMEWSTNQPGAPLGLT